MRRKLKIEYNPNQSGCQGRSGDGSIKGELKTWRECDFIG
jgi:hypothetical protein